jgi:hypothetical protein
MDPLPMWGRYTGLLVGAVGGVGASMLGLGHPAFTVTSMSLAGVSLGSWLDLRREMRRKDEALNEQAQGMMGSLEELQQRYDEMFRINVALEDRVAARTRELTEANVRLEAALAKQKELDRLKSEFFDNGAARKVAAEGDPSTAAIAGVDVAAIAGLTVLAERIQTEKDNVTKFAVIGAGDPGLGAADKSSLVMVVLDRPGSLLGALQPFAARGINLHKLESRPRRGAPFEYLFYVDFMAPADDPDVEAALKEVRQHTSLLKILGSYRSAGEPV